uniref:T6D22.25 n=1 Tax=Arabidopsis thaliana TaxID=3702 RepID=Q9LMZ2_ARATH|nr:T6D22.25 [Arabidopsis thaliana]
MNYDRHLSPGAGSMANNKSKVEPKTHEEDLRVSRLMMIIIIILFTSILLIIMTTLLILS